MEEAVGGLGSTLREARLRRGMTLEGAAAETRIGREILAALEGEQFWALPHSAYAQGLLRLYARWLGLDAEPLVAQLPAAAEPAPARRRPASRFRIPEFGLGTAMLLIVLLLLVAAWLYLRGENTAAADGSEPIIVELSTPTPTATPTPIVEPTATLTPALPALAPPPAAPRPTPQPPQATPTPRPPEETIASLRVPSVVGMTSSLAESILRASGFGVQIREETNPVVQAGIVLEQEPRPGASLPPAGVVLLTVSQAPPIITVPNVIGLPEGEARRVLTAAGLAPSPWTNYQRWEELPEHTRLPVCVGCVLSITPPPGRELPSGATVHIAVRAD